jgi:hypothetical protein
VDQFGLYTEYPSWQYYGSAASTEPTDLLTVELYPTLGGPNTPGTYSITAAETSYETCGFCLYIGTACSGSVCEKYFMPTEQGSYTITDMDAAVGGDYAGTLTGVVLQEVVVDWDGSGGTLYETTPVPNGETWTLDGVSWSVTLE